MEVVKLKNSAAREVLENVLLLLLAPLFSFLAFLDGVGNSLRELGLLAVTLLFGACWGLFFLFRLLLSLQTVHLTPEAIVIRLPLGVLARITPDSLVRVRAMNITINAGRHTHVYRKIVVFCSTDAEEIRYHKNRRRGAGYWFITPTEENKQALLAYLRAHAPEVPFGISLL